MGCIAKIAGIATIGGALLALPLSVSPAVADLDSALAAFARSDYPAARRALEPLAGAGDPLAQYNLGVLYDRGRGAIAESW